MQGMNIDNVTYGNNEYNVGSLSHQFLERILECLMQTEVGPIGDLTVVWWVHTATLRKKLYQNQDKNDYTLPTKMSDRVSTVIVIFTRTFGSC